MSFLYEKFGVQGKPDPREQGKMQRVKAIEKVFLIFIIGSICGYIFETIVVLFQKGHFEIRQGVIYGPFIPVYGLGGIMYYII